MVLKVKQMPGSLKNEFTTLFHMARGGDSWKESLDWLKEKVKFCTV